MENEEGRAGQKKQRFGMTQPKLQSSQKKEIKKGDRMKKPREYKRHLRKYVRESLRKGYSYKAIEKALVNYGYEPVFAGNLIESCKLRSNLAKAIPLFFVSIAMLFLFLKPSIVSHVVVAEAHNFTYKIDLNANESIEYLWDLENKGVLQSLRLSGRAKAGGIVKAYLEHENRSYLIFDSRHAENALEEITGAAIKDENESKEDKDKKDKDKDETKTNETIPEENTTTPLNITPIINETINIIPIINETLIINKSIEIGLQYNKNTPYDTNDDGIELATNAIDFTVAESRFNWGYNESNLCTRWEIYPAEGDKSTLLCYGSANCCGFFGLAPARESWKEPLYLAYGQYGAAFNNIVSAQVLSINYNLSIEDPFFEIYFSDWKNLTAAFYEGFVIFENECIETCALNFNATSYRLRLEIENSTLMLESINYEVLQEEEKINHAPVLLKNFSNISIFSKQSYTLNLSEYFYDEDNDTLIFSNYNNSEIYVSIANETAVLSPSGNFTGTAYMFFTASDSAESAVSNVFEVEIKERKLEEISGLKSLRRIAGLI